MMTPGGMIPPEWVPVEDIGLYRQAQKMGCNYQERCAILATLQQDAGLAYAAHIRWLSDHGIEIVLPHTLEELRRLRARCIEIGERAEKTRGADRDGSK